MKAKKSLGQHFLKSERALNMIVESGEIVKGETVLEIGPGQGALTEKLLAYDLQLVAIEKDDALYEYLKEKFKKEIESGKLRLLHDDILNSDLSQLQSVNYKLIANIPYNITGAILKKFLSSTYPPLQMVLLVQREVAKRIVAEDGKESILSISVKAYGEPRYIETVKAGSFAPAPKVDSAIISIHNISKDYFKSFSEEFFFKLVHAGFRSKRKKLSSNLSQVVDRSAVMNAFMRLNLNENVRAETLSIEEWGGLVLALS